MFSRRDFIKSGVAAGTVASFAATPGAFAAGLMADPRVGDFRILASHQESLHSHDAVSVLTEGATFASDSLDPRLFASLIHHG